MLPSYSESRPVGLPQSGLCETRYRRRKTRSKHYAHNLPRLVPANNYVVSVRASELLELVAEFEMMMTALQALTTQQHPGRAAE